MSWMEDSQVDPMSLDGFGLRNDVDDAQTGDRANREANFISGTHAEQLGIPGFERNSHGSSWGDSR